MYAAYGVNVDAYLPALFLVNPDSDEYGGSDSEIKDPKEEFPFLSEYLMDNFTKEERETLKDTKFFYEIIFEKPGGLVMPILVDYIYTDGTKESKYYPAEIWRFNDKQVKKLFTSDKEIKEINIDPNQLTADIDLENNSWPKKKEDSQFDKFKENTVKK